jgi:endonuclease YncB( thermonuclease family)
MPRAAIVFILLFAFVLSPALSVAAPDAAVVVDAPDATTLDVQLENGTLARAQLLGLDAPSCHASDAVARVQQLMADGPVTFQFDDAQTPDAVDPSGYAWLGDGRNLAEVLLREGFARRGVGSTHPRDQEFAAAQAEAVTAHAGIWAPGACVGAPDSTADAGALGTLVWSSSQGVQQAQIGMNVLHEQTLSAPMLVSSPDWQRTTAMGVGWMRTAGQGLQQAASGPASSDPVSQEVAQLGRQLQAHADAYAQASSAADVAQLQQIAAQIDVTNGVLVGVAAELNALGAAYGVGD